jgi:hypothetical protein
MGHTEEAQGRCTNGPCIRRRQGPLDQGAAVRSNLDHQRGPRLCRRMASIEPRPVAGQPGDKTASAAQASAPIQRRAVRSSARLRRRKLQSGSQRSPRSRAAFENVVGYLVVQIVENEGCDRAPPPAEIREQDFAQGGAARRLPHRPPAAGPAGHFFPAPYHPSLRFEGGTISPASFPVCI